MNTIRAGSYLIGVTLVFVIVIYAVRYLCQKARLFIQGNKLPGPKGWPLIGNILEVVEYDLG